jgi:poly(ADP-ribose) glycohydrolase ARH3
VETIESLVRAFWQDKARGLLLGQACAEAIAAPFIGRVTVSNQEFAARSDGRDILRYGAGTALTLAVAGHAATLGPELEIDGDTLATSLAHMWWTSQDRTGYGIDDQRQFQALLSGQEPVVASSSDVPRPRMGVTAAVPAAVLALTTSNLSSLSAVARACAAVMNADAVEQGGAAVHACAVALALGNDPHRSLNGERALNRLREVAHPDLVAPLSLVRQLRRDATPAAAAQALGTGEHGVTSSVPTALLAFLRFPDDPVACVRFAVKVGGQTTTTAALAGALLGARLGESGLPRQWLERADRAEQLRASAERLTEIHKFQLV